MSGYGVHWYDIDGNEIDARTASRLLADIDARRIAYDEGPWGSLSTVHLVLDHSMPWLDEPPMIFESMHFDTDGTDRDCVRTSNRHAALAAHDQMLAELNRQGST